MMLMSKHFLINRYFKTTYMCTFRGLCDCCSKWILNEEEKTAYEIK